MFDITGSGKQVQLAWPSAGSGNAWLALDRNGNGRIDDGTELFGNDTPQPGPHGMGNGFKALAVYDQPANGGNGDGWISAKDAVYSKLRLWVDKNHNGISEPDELITLPQAGIEAISLEYRPAKWQDAYGNQFRLRSQIVRETHGNGEKKEWIYDVALTVANGKS